MAETDPAAVVVTDTKVDNPKDTAKDNQQGASDWTKDFDEGLRKRLEKFKTPSDLAKSYVELETMQSKAFQDMTPEEKEKYLKRLGLPESAEGYELSDVALPEGVPKNVEADKAFKELAKNLKLTKDQAKGGHEWLMKRAAATISAQREAMKRQTEERESALRTTWGSAYDANQAAVEKLLKLGGDEFTQFMNSGPGKEAAVRKGLYAISKLLADETLVSGVVTQRKQEIPKGFVFDPSLSPELAETSRTTR
jgi:hypothetical protein